MNRRRHQPMLAAMNFPMSFAKLRANVRVPPHQTSGRSRPLLPPCTLARQRETGTGALRPALLARGPITALSAAARSICLSSLSYTPILIPAHPAATTATATAATRLGSVTAK